MVVQLALTKNLFQPIDFRMMEPEVLKCYIFSSANMSSLKHSIACFPNTPVICQSSTKPLPLFEAALQNKQQCFCAMDSVFTLASGLNNPVLNCFQIPRVTKAETTDLGRLAFHQKVHFLLNHTLNTDFPLLCLCNLLRLHGL